MENVKLQKWADLLLDTGKRNNLINFKDTKLGTLEVVVPMFDVLFSKIEHLTSFEIFDPKLFEDEEKEEKVKEDKKRINKADFLLKYTGKIKKSKELLLFNEYESPIKVLSNLAKKARTAIEETGVNIAYMAFGFINWFEEDKNATYKAPILLVPISIENESAIEPYYIKVIDSEIIVNPTFLFKLKNEYGIELPTYNDEMVGEYLDRIEEIISRLNWSVVRECKIGLFSFQKINMHKDLKDNAETILKNDGVLALLGEKSFSLEEEKCTETEELFTVVDADSSQVEAIEMAKQGKSFVLQGPPGTGKSQTITNIIAECLADGKKVLFVSEKLAALSVVYEKLKRANLDEFCLELHSHKANKKDVIKELIHTLKGGSSNLSSRAEKEISDKIRAEKELNEYAEELHKEREGINKSLFSLFEEVSATRNAPDMDYIIKDIELKGEEYLESVEKALNSYASFTLSIGEDYHENPFYGYKETDVNFKGITELKIELKDCIFLIENIIKINEELFSKYSIIVKNIHEAYALRAFFSLASFSDFLIPGLLKEHAVINSIPIVRGMKTIASEVLKIKEKIDLFFDEGVYKLNGKLLHKKLSKEYDNFFTRLFSREYKNIIKDIKLCKKDNKRVSYPKALCLMETLGNYNQKLYEFSLLEKKLISLIGTGYEGVYTNFDKLLLELDMLTNIHEAKVDFGMLKNAKVDNFALYKEEFNEFFEKFSAIFNGLEKTEESLYLKFNTDEFNARRKDLLKLIKKYQGCLENIESVDNYAQFNKLLVLLKELGIKDFVDKAIKLKVEPKLILLAYKKVFYLEWVDIILHSSKTLMALSRIPHDEAVKTFSKKDQLLFDINKAKIKAMLSNNRPSLDMVASGSAVSILLREGEKKRKQKSVRLLLEEIGELALTLKPCFLMSPLSVSTFLSPNMKFDVVIFDEASQIFPQDAIGAIYRGKQLIVVGDSKQMPPSNFFNSSIEQDDEDDDVTDFESILDLCSVSFPQKRLKWHYRSRFEQLIAFSNRNFYDSELVTFPSSKIKKKGIGVDYIFADGIFDRSTKTNKIEAEKIVDLVFEHFNKYPSRSLGVVAFSISQQSLIEKLILKRRALNPVMEEFFRSDKKEPFFVKNLETVQGDERDTIIFSVAYGKDKDGKLLLNFGPINKNGGERRLNVAFTRAKYNIKLVSSMHHTDIDLERTSSVGARLLKEYLDYAENGENALEKVENDNDFAKTHSEFVEEVYDFLREKGYIVDKNVGCSSIKIDIGLKHNETLDYVLAIECDGKAYLNSKSTRDRDRLRKQILEGMGWKHYRIWSTDWFRNKRVEKENLLKAVKLAMEKAIVRESAIEEENKKISFEEKKEKAHFKFPKYEMADMKKIISKYYTSKLAVIRAIVEVEAPISEEWLLKRICFLFGKEKVTSQVREQYNYLMQGCRSENVIRKDGFLFTSSLKVPMLRVAGEDSLTIREIKDIHLEELANGIREILKQNVTVERGGLYKLLASQLGYHHVGKAMEERFNSALSLLEKEVDIDGNVLSLK